MLETVITSSILILAVIIIRLAFRQNISRRVRYALWGLVLLRLMIPVSLIQSPVSIMNIFLGNTVDYVDAVNPEAAPAVSDKTLFPTHQEIFAKTLNTEYSAIAPQKSSTNIAEYFRIIWLCGLVLCAAWFIPVNIFFYKNLRRNRRPFDASDFMLPVYIADTGRSPFLFGIIRPSVYLTEDASSNSEALRYVLAHEYTHYKRLDHIWAIFRAAVLCVYWFNPLVWLAAFLSRADGELACDEVLIKTLGQEHRFAYGRALIDMIPVNKTPGLPVCATTMAASKRGMKTRILMIVSTKKTALPALVAALIIIIAAAGCTFTGADNPEKQTTGAPVESESVSEPEIAGTAESGTAIYQDAESMVEPPAKMTEVFEELRAGIISDKYDGTISFTLPDELFEFDDWTISVSGRAKMGDGGRSVHLFSEGSWTPDKVYQIDLWESNYTELYMTLSILAEQDGEWGTFAIEDIDLLAIAYSDSEPGYQYRADMYPTIASAVSGTLLAYPPDDITSISKGDISGESEEDFEQFAVNMFTGHILEDALGKGQYEEDLRRQHEECAAAY